MLLCEIKIHNSLRPTTIKAAEIWSKRQQLGLLSMYKEFDLDAEKQRTEKIKAFDLLDALSKSGTILMMPLSIMIIISSFLLWPLFRMSMAFFIASTIDVDLCFLLLIGTCFLFIHVLLLLMCWFDDCAFLSRMTLSYYYFRILVRITFSVTLPLCRYGTLKQLRVACGCCCKSLLWSWFNGYAC